MSNYKLVYVNVDKRWMRKGSRVVGYRKRRRRKWST